MDKEEVERWNPDFTDYLYQCCEFYLLILYYFHVFVGFTWSCFKHFAGETFLKKSKTNKNKFERGQTDEFELKLAKVGAIKKIK